VGLLNNLIKGVNKARSNSEKNSKKGSDMAKVSKTKTTAKKTPAKAA